MAQYDSKPKDPHRALTDAELKKLLGAAPPNRALLYRTALVTGFRAGELGALRVRDLDIFGPSLRLSGEFTKNRRDAQQPITRELARELQELVAGRETSELLFRMPKSYVVSENFNRDRKKAKIRPTTDAGKATFHSLRVNYINAVVVYSGDTHRYYPWCIPVYSGDTHRYYPGVFPVYSGDTHRYYP